ncbi:C40 family peptidase [Haloimpatiens sp. FM7315]|uniref:C40 family peptidase n=1 Tax=Haloimpatiens sp. FM7315 TaxID=3298609 RepID=UPI00370C48F4
MKLRRGRIIYFVLFLSCILICKGYQVKADTIIKDKASFKVKTVSIRVNKDIKVSKSASSVKRGSRGGDYTNTYNAGKSIVDYAYNFLGKPYVWGAEGPYAFDCSGLTLHVYRSFGIKLPHYTVYQANLGQGVEKSDLMPGDLIFFNTSGSLSHVGMYIGNGNFIHASSGSHRVIVSNLGQSYYKARYAKACRILSK